MTKKNAETYIVYRATFPNGKVYIGVTGQTLRARINQHRCKNSSCILLHRALVQPKNRNKVNWDIIETFTTADEALKAEVMYIESHKSFEREFGYNLTKGGDGCFGLKRPYLLQKLIDNSGNIFNGYEKAMEFYNFTRAQIRSSVVAKGYCGHVYFSKFKEGMTKANPRTVSRKYRRRVIDHINSIIFFSVSDACAYHNITQVKLASMCRKRFSPTFSFMDAL